MRPIAAGARFSHSVETDHRHTAEAFGNPGVRLVGTAALIGFVETAAHRCLAPYLEPGEGSLGVTIEVAHLAPARDGSVIEASAEVLSAEDRHVRFAIEAKMEDRILMKGVHERVVIDLERFLAKVGAEAPPS
jgi:fluoroacetyl-CoA thioesterase